jgi:hypothetical protein
MLVTHKHSHLKRDLQTSKDYSDTFSESLSKPDDLTQGSEFAAKRRAENKFFLDFHNNKITELTPQVMQADEAMRQAIAKHQSLKRQGELGIPDAPFKKNWHELALKKMIHHAALNGYDGIAVTPGAEQADRYGLAKHIDELAYWRDGDQIGLSAVGPKGTVLDQEYFPVANLPDFVGKELAEKILNGEGATKSITGFPEEPGVSFLSQEGLKVGGEGMKGFYDKMIPSFLNQFGKKYGVKTESRAINTDDRNGPSKTEMLRASGIPETQWGDIPYAQQERMMSDYAAKQPPKTATVHHFPITPEMRKDVLTNGLPLYAEGGIIHKAEGGNVQPSLAQMKMALAQKSNSVDLKSVGVNEAPNMFPKHFFPADVSDIGLPSPGGVATPRGMPIGGIDMSTQQDGQQLMPNQPMQPQAPGQPPEAGGLPPGAPANPGDPGNPAGQAPPMGNMLSMTPQGQAMSAMRPQGLAEGGQPSVEAMKSEMAAKDSSQDKRVTIKAEGSGGVKGIVVPRHTLEGNAKSGAVGLHEMNEARSKVYGNEHRDPLTLSKMANQHKQTLTDHFSKPIEEQHAAEEEATERLRKAKHLGKDANTLDKSEKLDTVRHEHDEQGRSHIGFASKGVAGHALYTTGKGKDTKYQVINTCPGQTEGCGGGKDSNGIIDTKKGTCFAPNAESQYPAAATRRAAHEQAKHDPKMTNDWILAHTGSLRKASELADKGNQRLLFRPNVVDETDVSSRHVIRHLNEQRKVNNKPPIIANSYGKTNELHDPENGYYVTHSNVGPKVKKGQEIAENVGRDKARVRNTIMAADNKGDFTNEQGNKTPPKGSYMVTDVKRGSPMAKKMEGAITHAKYWTTGRHESELTSSEKDEGPEGHFSGSGRKTSEDKAHYGHTTLDGMRYDYQRQHILHPRLVNVPERKKNKTTGKMESVEHMIPTDSRFKDEEFLPKNRYKTKNGKDAGHILMTTPTESTSNIGHQTSFTHNVGDKHIEHAQKNNGEYEIDKPEDQAKAKGKEYSAPQAIKFYAEGGHVGGRHPGFEDDDFHAFPEQNVVAQRHLAMRHGEDEHKPASHKKGVVIHKDTGTMRLEMTMKKKAK